MLLSFSFHNMVLPNGSPSHVDIFVGLSAARYYVNLCHSQRIRHECFRLLGLVCGSLTHAGRLFFIYTRV